MAVKQSRPRISSPEDLISISPSPALSTQTNTPAIGRSPSPNTLEAQHRRKQRHSKKLSINFPILIPARPVDTPPSNYTASPTTLTMNQVSHGAYFSPPSTHASNTAIPTSISMPLPPTPPSEEDPAHVTTRPRGKSHSHFRQESTSAEFLTMLASQERRVLELKEELSRAETDLTSLKRQWALYEAGKKKNESKRASVRMESAVPSHARAASTVEAGAGLGLLGLDEPLSDDKLEEEREKRREIARERMMGRWTCAESGQAGANNSKKSGQRVFSSSRHTRTLSLLASNPGLRIEPGDVTDSPTTGKSSLDSARQSAVETPATESTPSMPTLSRANSGLDALNFGKTYKDLASAAARKNLPPGLNPEQFVKQGKQVVDGVRDGLWNFIEDIRQATIGDEVITGANGGGVRRQNSTKQPSGQSKPKRTMTDGSERSVTSPKDAKSENEPSFWKEFGVDTPKSDKTKRDSTGKDQRPGLPGRWPSTKTGEDFAKNYHKQEGEVPGKKTKSNSTKSKRKEGVEHHESKSSTDSTKPPSLVADLLEEEDEGWDNWSSTDPGSPQVNRKRSSKRVVKLAEDETKEVHWHDLMS